MNGGERLKRFVAVITAMIILTGCGKADETYRPEPYVRSEETNTESPEASIAPEADLKVSTVSSSSSVRTSSAQPAESKTSTVSHNISQSVNSDSGKLAFTLENFFSKGNYYSVVVSGTKSDTEGKNTIVIEGILYGDLALTLMKNGRQADRLPIEVPYGEHFVLLENLANDLSYGYDLISNMRDFGAEEYPDIIGLIFQSDNSEAAVPIYERFFTVFGGKLAELPIYENGYEVNPRGAKLEPKSAGVAVQHLTVPKSSGDGYEIVKYQYSFDTENKRLNKQQVRFYGWEID